MNEAARAATPYRSRAKEKSRIAGMVEMHDGRQPVTAVAAAAGRRGNWRQWAVIQPWFGPPRILLLVIVTLPLWLLADHWCLIAARVPMTIQVSPSIILVNADGGLLETSLRGMPDTVRFIPASPTAREYQIDGTDNTNNFTEDAADLATLLPTPEYQFEAWMRSNAAYGAWVNIIVSAGETHTLIPQKWGSAIGQNVALPRGHEVEIRAELQRPEAPAYVELLSGGQTVATLSVDRNDRSLKLIGANASPVETFFPIQSRPFAAEVLDSLLRIAIWAWILLTIAFALTSGFAFGGRLAWRWNATITAAPLVGMARQLLAKGKHGSPINGMAKVARKNGTTNAHWWTEVWTEILRRTTWADRAVAGVLAVALGFTILVALAQYQGEPHILDASAYYFQAKIFASGHLSAPAPADLAAFQGPFMVAYQGRWFAQYPPATSALLALGMLLGAPWLVEPLLGIAALGGVYLLGRRMFGGPTAVLAVALGALSPFFIYLAASYLSHTVALFFEVYFLVFVLRYLEGYRRRDIVVAGACLGAMLSARELSAVICGVVVTSWLLAWHGRRLWHDRGAVVPGVLAGLTALGVGLALYLGYNLAQTGNPLVLPRNLFSPADRYGFGVGVGFYGQHTLAAGLVVLDQLLTSLMIDLYGWPFYLTLALIPLALLRRDTARRWDWFSLTVAGSLIVAQVGYFYHGIFLGPRYLYEALPFLFLLTARGITALPELVAQIGWRIHILLQGIHVGAKETESPSPARRYRRREAWWATGIIVVALVGFNVTFYLPRQVSQHQDFTGLPAYAQVDVATIYNDHPSHALIVTENWLVYNYIVWPLDDPFLRGDVLYAFAPGPADVTRLRQEFPDRAFYALNIGANGAVSFISLP